MGCTLVPFATSEPATSSCAPDSALTIAPGASVSVRPYGTVTGQVSACVVPALHVSLDVSVPQCEMPPSFSGIAESGAVLSLSFPELSIALTANQYVTPLVSPPT